MNKIIILLLIIQSLSSVAQELKNNSITINTECGIAYRQIINDENNIKSLYLEKPDSYYLIGINYSWLFSQIEVGFSINTSVFNTNAKLNSNVFTLSDGTQINGLIVMDYKNYNFQFAPNLTYIWLKKSHFNMYSSFSTGVNHIYRDVYRVRMDFDAVLTDRDTTYINGFLKDFRPINFSARIATGASIQLSESFFMKPELFYESKLYSIYAGSPSDNNKAWTRFYNYGVNVGLRYCF